ncbi:MAG TPA: GAF and ANTAR domain-containing protein [Mycobacteriales bacterium]|nr:GAF and ANTAR domain-containing protein [Mycobacteriales bacterium]
MHDDGERWARLLAVAGHERAAQPLRICQLCVDALGVSGAGIAMVTAAGHRGVVCATDDVSATIEDLQLTLGEGPCVDAADTGTPVMLADLGASSDVAVERWPAFMEGAVGAGVKAVFALPLRIGAINVGVLDLYRDRPGGLNADELSAALIAADAAALALLYLDVDGADAFTDNQDARASYQLQVHQATGMVLVQTGVTIYQAFLMLRARAFAEGRPLAELAADVVAGRVRFSTEDR